MKKIFSSKRFIAFAVCVVLFMILIFLTHYTPMECAGALSIIAGIYIGAETVKPTTNSENK